MKVLEYPPPDSDPYVMRAFCFDHWPFAEAHVALDPTVVARRIGSDGRLTRQIFGTWSLEEGNFLVELADGTTVLCLCQTDLDLYLNRTGTP